MERLENVCQDLANKDLPDINLLELFLKPENQNLYQDIEGVMSSMMRVTLLISVESVVETWISTMKHYAFQRRWRYTVTPLPR